MWKKKKVSHVLQTWLPHWAMGRKIWLLKEALRKEENRVFIISNKTQSSAEETSGLDFGCGSHENERAIEPR